MIDPIKQIISEYHSPLFRIMWVTNSNDSSHRQFDNNISAFHIGGGIILSVAHNLRTENPFLKSIPATIFNNQLMPLLNQAQQQLFSSVYIRDNETFHISNSNAAQIKALTDVYQQINFDKRWVTLSKQNLSIPHLIVQFNNGLFYNDKELTTEFRVENQFFEPTLNRYTFLLQLELLHADYASDIAIYRISNCSEKILKKLPYTEPDFSFVGDDQKQMYCLQSSPAGYLGRLLNKAQIEGYLDQYQVFNDRIGGNYVLEGLRYLIKGYFRFGSSGAPYLIYNESTGKFRVNAIQSEASPIQLSINHNREGNFQYVNAIASPLSNVKEVLEGFIKSTV